MLASNADPQHREFTHLKLWMMVCDGCLHVVLFASTVYIAHMAQAMHCCVGPELEAEGLDVGIVTAIAAPSTLHVEFHGDGGHAGGQLMPLR